MYPLDALACWEVSYGSLLVYILFVAINSTKILLQKKFKSQVTHVDSVNSER
jgi:hypothetical protein